MEGVETTHVTHFRVSGESITSFARQFVLEGNWEAALRLLVEDLHGMTWDLAVGILKGEKKLVGMSDDPEGFN